MIELFYALNHREVKMFKKKKALLVGPGACRNPTCYRSFRNSLSFNTVYKLLSEISQFVRIFVVVDLSLYLLKGLYCIGHVVE